MTTASIGSSIACIVALLWLLAAPLLGELRRVPQMYATIQEAIVAVEDGDTVLVAPGTYAEELTAPPFRFWLIGDVGIDTGNFARPTIDPSTLDNPTVRRCLTIPAGCELTVERMAFVNRAPMYPRTGWNVGGVYANSLLPTTFRHCAFDSVWIAISDNIGELPPRVRYTVEDCRFTRAPCLQVHARFSDSLTVQRCYFEGHRSRSRLVHGGDNARIEDCVFTADSTAAVIRLWGEHLVIRNCVFGPIDTCAHDPVIFLTANDGAIVEGCVFHDIRTITPNGFCIFQSNGGDPIIFRHNVLLNYRGSFSELQFEDLLDRPERTAYIDSNLFQNGLQDSTWAAAKTLWLWLQASLTGNHFVDLLPHETACVLSFGLPWAPPNELRYNQFQAADYAVFSPFSPVDAVANFWGHVSGPYNATYNPQGQGARVDDAVLFDPWCIDTSCNLPVAGMPAPWPARFTLEAFPNPFNSILHLTLTPADVRIVRVELYDVLGRQIAGIWNGPLAIRKKITFDASHLASGIYFVRVQDVIGRDVLAMTKAVLLR